MEEHEDMSQLKTLFLLALLTVILVYAGRLIGGNGGMAMA
jgi:hypothetical protein